MSKAPVLTHTDIESWTKNWAWLFPGAFCSFETFFVLFLFAGIFKSDARFAFIEIDLTVLFVGLSSIAAIVVVLRDGVHISDNRLSMLLAAAMFFGYVALSYLWTPGILYATKKTLSVCVLTGWCFVACALIISSNRDRVRRFMVLMVVLAIWLAYESFVSYGLSGGGRSLRVLNHDYLGLGQTIGPAALIVLGYLVFYARSPMIRLAGFGLFSAFVMVMLILGGRTPLCAMSMGVVTLCYISFAAKQTQLSQKIKRNLLAKYVVGALISVALLFTFLGTDRLPATLSRLGKVYANGLDGFIAKAETNGHSRPAMFLEAVQMWQEAPILGSGIGSFPLFYVNRDVRGFPHNIILETLAEYGILGTALLGLLFFLSFRSLGPLKTIANDPIRIIISMMFTTAICNAMVSGDMSDNRFMFAVLGLMAMRKYGWNSYEENSSHLVMPSDKRHPHFSKRVQNVGQGRVQHCADSATRS